MKRDRSGRGIVVLGVVGAVVLTSLLSGSGPVVDLAVPVAPPAPAVSEAPDAATAMLAARRQGSLVEVLAERTETRSVFADPEGGMTAELTVEATRVQRGTTWVPVDTTLERRPDGTVAPKAAQGDLTLSGGGSDAPLAKLTKDGKVLSWYWPGVLPKPVLSGGEATYPEVLPGVDLVMRAERSGYRQHLVIKDAEAARNPALARIDFRMAAQGVRVSVDGAGMLRADDDAGQQVFTAPPPLMWDATGTSRSVRVGVEIGDGILTLLPDLKFLADPATVYPVVVDPDWRTFGWSTWGTVLSGPTVRDDRYPRTSGDGPGVAQVGQCYPRGGRCEDIQIARAYFQFDTGFLAGKTILEATFDTAVVHSPDCEAGPGQPAKPPHFHQLWKPRWGIDDNLTWLNQPGEEFLSGELVAPRSNGTWGCPAWQPAGFRATSAVIAGGVTTVMLRASDEGNPDAWRKYNPVKGANPDGDGVKLRVRYNTRPNNPTNLWTEPNVPAPCHWCGGVSYLGDREIRLHAVLSDPDPEPWVKGVWRYTINDANPPTAAWDGPGLHNGVDHSTDPINLDAFEGKKFSWWVHAGDEVITSVAVGPPAGFIVDRTRPNSKPKVSAMLYQEENAWHGGVGVDDTFTFEANSVTDIDHYEYGWQPEPTTKVLAAGRLSGPASVRLTPPGDGPRTLYVRSVDRAGHRSDTTHYRIYVRAGNGPYTQYSFEGNTNDDAFLGDRDGTLRGGAAYAPGAVGTGLVFDGNDSSTMTARNSVRTDTSFSVSAWVRPDALPAGVMGVVSQDSAASDPARGSSGWFLDYRDDGQGPKWAFYLQSGDAARPGWQGPSGRVPQQGKWTHLTGVYDRLANTAQLYVDGVPVAAPYALPAGFVSAQASGQFVVGRNQWQGVFGNPWRGAIDEVRVFDRPLSAAEVKATVSKDNVQVAHWQFEETTGTTAKNSVAGGEYGVLSGGAGFIDRGAVGRAVQFNGTDGQMATSGPSVRTDQSFSVAAWVWADRFVTDGKSMTAVSQDGTANSGFYLKYDSGHGKWVFSKMTTDNSSPVGVGALARQAPIAGNWVHLAGVFDAQSKQLRIYVNGEEGGAVTLSESLWHATGPLVVGRAKLRGDPVDYWPGSVDEVRMYSRVLTEAEIKGIVVQNNVTAGSWKLDGSAVDDSGRARGGTPVGGLSWSAGQASVPDSADLAGLFDGTDDYVRALNTVNTSVSFSVAAWVRPDKPGSWSTVVSQDGSVGSGFSIVAGGDGRWRLFVAAQDKADPSGTWAFGGTVQYGVWTHVAGVYSKERQRIELYVNGVLVADEAHAGGPNTTGDWQIGRVKWNGDHVNYFAGAIDDITAYSRPLFAEEIRAMAGRDLTLVHNWALDEGSGSVAADSIGARAATLSNGAGYTPGKLGNAVRLDGRDDSVATAGIDLRTDQSFSVSAWIWMDRAECGQTECRKDAVSIDGGGQRNFSKLRLGHIQNQGSAPDGKWIFEMTEPDGSVTDAAVTRAPGDVGAWVFLVGVYDAPSKKIWLYVNANRIDDGTVLQPWQSTGPLRIGRATVNGAAAAFWEGNVDEVRLYSTLLDKDRITALYRSYPANAAAPSVPVADAGHWKLDQNAADSSGRGRPATPRGTAGWGGGRLNAALSLDGTDDHAETEGPVLATNQSFSVTAWAHLTQTTGGNRAVLGQDRNQVSSFMLSYNEVAGKWSVVAPTTDGANPQPVVVNSATPAVPGQWAHLGVVYDASLRQLRLYVNGVLSAAQTGVSIMDSAGRFSIGRGRWANQNAYFFPGGVDDVQAFGRALSDGEVRKIHDSAPIMNHGRWTFDGTLVDSSFRNNPTTLSGAPSYVAGVNGQALQLDGTAMAATTGTASVNPVESFTVSAWARLGRDDKDATIVGQDGVRTSGFLLQYNRNVGRWVFGVPVQDADGAEFVYAYSPQAPALNTWTHLTGVYDHAARQFRLYVNGVLAGVRSNVAVLPAWGAFTIGRGKINGGPAGYFPGALDDVHTDLGIPTDEQIRARAIRPAAN